MTEPFRNVFKKTRRRTLHRIPPDFVRSTRWRSRTFEFRVGATGQWRASKSRRRFVRLMTKRTTDSNVPSLRSCVFLTPSRRVAIIETKTLGFRPNDQTAYEPILFGGVISVWNIRERIIVAGRAKYLPGACFRTAFCFTSTPRTLYVVRLKYSRARRTLFIHKRITPNQSPGQRT